MVNDSTKQESTVESPTEPGTNPAESQPKEKHPIAFAVNALLHNVRDIETLGRVYVPLCRERRQKRFQDLIDEMENTVQLLKEDDLAPQRAARAALVVKVLDAMLAFDRLSKSDAPKMLESSLFLGLFSAYDVYTGDLLTAIYTKKPELFGRVSRTMPVSEILRYNSFENLKETILQAEIESFRRKSYVEQFEDLRISFGITLTDFARWPGFVECGQRRNLITHCGGIVSEQYLKVCSEEGYSFPETVSLGQKLEVGSDYLLASCDLIMEVGFKLGQTLWRKLFPEELNEADSHLSNVIYDCLRTKRWDRAVVFSEFAIGQRKLFSDVNRKIYTINHAIALKFSGQGAKAAEVLSQVDWSGAALDFKLAEAVLTDKYHEAAAWMKRIGKAGQFIIEPAYHEWPLFNEFRQTSEFLDAYESIFGHPFVAELERMVSRAQAAGRDEMDQEPDQGPPVIANETENEDKPSGAPTVHGLSQGDSNGSSSSESTA